MSRRGLIILGAVLIVLAGGAALALFLTGGTEEARAVTTTTAAPTTTTTVPPPVAPLTGLPVDDPAVLSRVALIVKIDNVDSLSRPQAGINQADLIYEEKIEGPVTRFAAVFQSEGHDPVGPVRSGRSTDIAIATPLHLPLYAFSGANAVTVKELRAAPLVDIGYDVQSSAYYRQAGRRAPDNLFSSTDALWALTPADSQPPTPLFTYRRPADSLPSSAIDVASLDVSFGTGPGSAPVQWVWKPSGGAWVRSQNGTAHVDESDAQVSRQNVIVQFVDYVDTGLVDTAGTAVPEAELVGEGDAWVFTDGAVIVGRWSRPTIDDITSWTDAAGQAIDLTPGKTWVALVPIGAESTFTTCTDAPDSPACS